MFVNRISDTLEGQTELNITTKICSKNICENSGPENYVQ